MTTSTIASSFILLNGCYGGYGIADAALAELEMRHPEEDWSSGYDDKHRRNPRVIRLFKTNKKLFNEHGTSLYCEEIPKDAIAANAWSIREYDGCEKLKINWEKVHTFKTRQILYSEDLSNEEKIAQLKGLIE